MKTGLIFILLMLPSPLPPPPSPPSLRPLSDQVLDMKAGDLFIVRYSAVGELVQDGRAVLV